MARTRALENMLLYQLTKTVQSFLFIIWNISWRRDGSVHIWNISKTTGWSATELYLDVHGPQRMNPTLVTLPPAPPWVVLAWVNYLSNYLMEFMPPSEWIIIMILITPELFTSSHHQVKILICLKSYRLHSEIYSQDLFRLSVPQVHPEIEKRFVCFSCGLELVVGWFGSEAAGHFRCF